MNIFNSLGSNYNLASALRTLFAIGGSKAKQELSSYLEKRYGGRAVLTYKGRDALTLALNTVLEKGKVAFNGYTCLAVYESIVESGNEPFYLDISENSLDFSADTLRNALNIAKVQAVIVQNTLGFPCDIGAIEQLCKERGIMLIEDLAHSIGARYTDGREAGTVGDFVILSFSQDKVVDAVSGGALIVRNETSTIAESMQKVAEIQQWKDALYPLLTWKIRMAYAIGIGRPYHAIVKSLGVLSSPFGKKYPPRSLPGWYCSNISFQFKCLDRIAEHRKEIAEIYRVELNGALQLPLELNSASTLRFPILVPGRDRLIERLRSAGVHVSDIWYDAPIAPKKYMHEATYNGECPNAEKISQQMLNLPTHLNVSIESAKRIARLVNEWYVTESETDYSVRAVEEADWEAFLAKQKPHSFLHSWKWGQENESTGNTVFRLGIWKGTDLVALAQLIKVVARRGSFLLCPHGPVIGESEKSDELLRIVAREATRIARAERCGFLRFCPLAKDTDDEERLYRGLGFSDAPIHMHPELAWMLDITKPEDELLRDMRKTTRYLIKKMEKEGVEISVSTNPEDIELFWPVYQATVQRQQFTPFKKADLREEFELFVKKDGAAFFFGKHDGKIVAAAIIIFYNGQAFYHHSGSTAAGSNVSYLLQWRVIQEAKRRGCTLYNFWGISPPDRPNHPWAGLSLFKKGFGGFAEEYLHAQDKPLTSKYALNYIIETARRMRRGL